MRIALLFCLILVLSISADVSADTPYVVLQTNFGDITLELFAADAPGTVENFLKYVNTGFYDGLIFHRVMKKFMIQGGGRDVNFIKKTPTYDPIINENYNGLKNDRGTIAMARTTDPNSATSEFFINHKNNDFLNLGDPNVNPNDPFGYCVFGSVIDGMDVVDTIAALDVEQTVPVVPPGPVVFTAKAYETYTPVVPGDLDDDGNVNITDFDILAQQWDRCADSQEQKLTAVSPRGADWFGYSVAADGDYALVGTIKDDDTARDSGSVSVFQRGETDWTIQAKLIDENGADRDWFGFSVSISGNYAAVGAPGRNEAGTKSGCAYIFARTGDTWTKRSKLTPPDAAPDAWFGYSVSISGDSAMVGTPGDNEKGTKAGAVYIFQPGDPNWPMQQKITAEDAQADDKFGFSVCINGDYAIVGAIKDDDSGDDAGAVYILHFDGENWLQQQKLLPSDGQAGNWFGYSVSIDGDYAAAGAIYDDENGANSGSAYIFKRYGQTWIEEAKLTASDAAPGDKFGYSVSVTGDTVIVGARLDDDNGSGSGSAYVFSRKGLDWSFGQKLTASDGAAGDWLGFSVAGSDDYAIVGAYTGDTGSEDSGAAYIFNLYQPQEPTGDGCMDIEDLAIVAANWLIQ
jgi:cyclophilin family peptidyl-prolyl cis-trans isomerase